jgi:Animal haem peroxidase
VESSCRHGVSTASDPRSDPRGLGSPPGHSLLSHTLAAVAEFVDRRVCAWHRVPWPLGLLLLIGIRNRLRDENLAHPVALPAASAPRPLGARAPAGCGRSADGSGNDRGYPTMGQAETAFGRNVALDHALVDPHRLNVPNPRKVANALLDRQELQEAEGLNLLAAAWIQFMIHDWFSHRRDREAPPLEIPVEAPDRWLGRQTMRVLRTKADDRQALDQPPLFRNTETHWWDASQLYGSSRKRQDALRAWMDGKLRLERDGHLPLASDGLELTGVNGNWWIGLSLLHTLFVREHNAICDRLQARYPNWCDDALFNHARLINAALLAKIHTVEWTPAILHNPTTEVGLRGNWWGLATERLHRLLGRLSDNEAVSGIPGSPVDHHGVPYALTEEFVSVYRLHPLLPDRFTFWSAGESEAEEEPLTLDLLSVSGLLTRPVYGKADLAAVAYSFGRMHPGRITLHNYPTTLRSLKTDDGTLDLATIEILRDRERGVPRYNEFRKLLHRNPIRSFDEFGPQLAGELRNVYGRADGRDRVEDLDLMIGLLAEAPPRGFAISDTAFRVFILMASRRLKSDRFFTTDYTPEVYTPEGIAWIEDNTMGSVLLRHLGGQGAVRLERALAGRANAFLPWA